MSIIKKMIFSVSEKGNSMCQLWVDDADVNKNSDSIYIALKNQVAYLYFLGVGSQITLKKSKQYYNIEVPETFTTLFENYKTSPDPTIKMIGSMLNNAFDNAFNSIEFLKNGETTKISQIEANAKCEEYLTGYSSLFEVVVEFFKKSKIPAFKNIAKLLTKEDAKSSELKDANDMVSKYVYMLSKDVIAKNNFIIE